MAHTRFARTMQADGGQRGVARLLKTRQASKMPLYAYYLFRFCLETGADIVRHSYTSLTVPGIAFRAERAHLSMIRLTIASLALNTQQPICGTSASAPHMDRRSNFAHKDAENSRGKRVAFAGSEPPTA